MKILLKRLSVPVLVWTTVLAGMAISWEPFYLLSFAALIVGILHAVHHAEVVSARIGEPFGAVVLAIAVTVIEVSIILSLMIESGDSNATLARDTVFAAVMIILNGMMGLTLLVGGIKFREQQFSLQGVRSALTVLVAISTFTLILPNFTQAVEGPYYHTSQLIFVAAVTLILYASFLFVQNFRHRQDFMAKEEQDEPHHPRPEVKTTIASAILLPIFLVAVVLLAEHLAPELEHLIERAGAPKEIAGVIIAVIILLPEGISALKAALQNKLQTSLNLSLGSALASIGLTIPSVAVVSLVTGLPLALGIDEEYMVLFILSLFINVLSLGTGRTSILHGIVLLITFVIYLMLVIIP